MTKEQKGSLILKEQQTWEFSGENKYNFEFFGPNPGKSDLKVWKDL